jgi:hypothetical protein
MLRGDFIARAYVPGKAARQREEVLRQRLYWARLHSRIRNRIHALIDRQRELAMPRCSDLFGRKALVALKKLSLVDPDATLLREEPQLLDLIQNQIRRCATSRARLKRLEARPSSSQPKVSDRKRCR